MRILIVEDNEINRILLRDILALLGAEIFEAAGGEEGIALSRAIKPDLIFMDLQLPKMDGFTATRAIKADPETKDIPVVAVSSYAFAGEKRRFFEAGGNGYLTKPLDVEEVFQVVKHFQGGAKNGRTKGENPGC
ncbi:response regulator [Desulfofundulus sp. TPOSR]|uniref:Stage 0 sporulation protein A homolog n=1 Tax=Desulfofundulus kuznetsovii (strain DSM 6115 / VKM B-1805 / 17) TaxID=760568 RepID=A0AAU8PDT9_DESK7|nr:response regulator [Desulfofundulus sp. TPOSR]AEG15591.1 response regulator receiver protein [Desulfofundulus kuznetsovii DSM 6115]NHM27746.1 response regulator [Desulfofundulus sp. TPOSR]